MQYFTAQDAAKLLGLNERTLRRYLRKGMLGRVIDEQGVVIFEGILPYTEPVRKINERFQIPLGNIQFLAEHIGKTTLAELDMEVTRLKAIVQTQGEQLQILMRLLQREPDKQRTGLPYNEHTQRKQRPDSRGLLSFVERTQRADTPEARKIGEEGTIYPDMIPSKQFADLHGIKDGTLRGQINDGIAGDHLPATKREKPGRPGEREYFLTQEQHLETVRFWHRHQRLDFYHTCFLCEDLWISLSHEE